MNSGFKSQAVPSYRVLTQEQIEEIHLASFRSVGDHRGTHSER